MIIAQDLGAYSVFAEELKARDWKVGVVGSFNEALTYIATDCPQIVLISYNHDDANLKNSPKILERRFNVQCVAFCERRAKNTAKLLLQSGLKNLLFPPITADAIFDKCSRMLRDRTKLKTRKAQATDSTGLNRPLFESDTAGKAANSAALFAAPPPVQHNYHDLSREEKSSLTSEGVISGSKNWYETIVLPSIEAVKTENVFGTDEDRWVDLQVVGLPVRSDKFNGILWTGASIRIDFISDFTEKLATELRRRASIQGMKFSCGEKIEFHLRRDEKFLFLSKTENKKRWESGTFEWQSGLIAADVMEPKTQDSKDQKIVTIESRDINLKSVLGFNLYIHLPKNKKFYLFVRNGRFLTEKRVSRLNQTEHELFIKREELAAFRAYVFKNRLLKSA
ncbi:MAG: hypothetical protein A4S09_11160 [Proteobacteria bacterium SG_bin7]|nr:MAG: hypothetical protein A4S09_11160 [Proteobacteria bacterium SG_bin7]